MSLDLYTIGYPEPLPPEQFQLLLDLLPGHLRQKVGRFRRWQDAHASLLGKLLLRTALLHGGRPADLSRLEYSDWQKPSLPHAPHFNISHSGNRVVCLLSDIGAVGIDIEALTPFSFDDLHAQFTAGEWEAIRGSDSPLTAFYRFWTAKESLTKADGRGLGIPLQEVDLSLSTDLTPTDIPGPGIRPDILLDGRRWSIHELPLFAGYACHYAVETPPPSVPPPAVVLHELTINQLYI